ncbi:uncharacterized protein [Dysidea avara]|uniref:uncharacterized protein n=1 Tax=Dysidea avara TaxID=196820 RepID=UPI003326A8A1
MMMILCVVTSIVLLATLTTAAVDDTCMRYGLDIDQPGASCSDIYGKNPNIQDQSGYYLIKTDHLFLAHCDKEDNGWMKVVDFDASRGDKCPTGWTGITVNNIRMCRSSSNSAGCYSTTFSVNGTRYRKIRGKLRGYQKYSTDGFYSSKSTSINDGKSTSINDAYADGISITIGNPRRHVWTYAAGLSDEHNSPQRNCPCAAVPGPTPPSFVGEYYYCESGNTGGWENIYYTDDPLWDGAGCVHPNNNCCTNAGLPWFIREFPIAQNDDIEVRICTDGNYSTNEAVLVDQLKLYVQ